MIKVYCVMVVGEPFLRGDEKKEFGFYRNEYVLAFSDDKAIALAKSRALKRLERKGVEFIKDKPFSLKVENIKSGFSPLWLLRNEGFLFFPIE